MEQVSGTDWGDEDKPMGDVALGGRKGVVGPGDWKREEAVAENIEDAENIENVISVDFVKAPIVKPYCPDKEEMLFR